MKTYIITEGDVKRLIELFCVPKLQSEELDKWVKTLNYKTDNPYDDLQREIEKLKKMLDDNI